MPYHSIIISTFIRPYIHSHIILIYCPTHTHRLTCTHADTHRHTSWQMTVEIRYNSLWRISWNILYSYLSSCHPNVTHTLIYSTEHKCHQAHICYTGAQVLDWNGITLVHLWPPVDAARPLGEKSFTAKALRIGTSTDQEINCKHTDSISSTVRSKQRLWVQQEWK